jgi:chitodextrinase
MHAAQVTLAWDPSPALDVIGYQVKYGSATAQYTSTIDAGDVTTITVSNLAAGGTYYFAVTAYNMDGRESAPSNEVVFAAPPNQPPLVALTSPVNDSVFAPSSGVTLSATASDADGSITRVEFYAGATLLGATTAKPYSLAWTPAESGFYRFTAKAFDNGGASAESAVVTATVVGSRPVIADPGRLQTGEFKFKVLGPANRNYTVHVSDDLITWTVLKTVAATGNTFEISDPTATTARRRFYKVAIE